MIWWIFSLCAFVASILCAVLFAFSEWFDRHETLENVLIVLSLLLVSPFIVFGVLWYEMLTNLSDEL